MATNIGDLSFTVRANTKEINAAVTELQKFARETNTAQRAIRNLREGTEAAFVRQEKAMQRAMLQSESLRRSLIRHGAADATIDKVTAAYEQLRNTMRVGALSTANFARAQTRFQYSLMGVKDNLYRLKKEGSEKHFDRMRNAMQNLSSASVLAIGPLSGLGARINALTAITNRSTLAWAAAFAAGSAFAIGLYKIVSIGVRAGLIMEQIESRLTSIAGSTKEARKEITYLREVSSKLGLVFQSVASEYAGFAIAARKGGLTADQSRQVFEGVATASSAMKLTAEQSTGAFRALQQMMSKGTVQAEELRGQLAERIPGAFQMAAEAMGVTTQELDRQLKAGQILASDLLPKLGEAFWRKYAIPAEAASKSLRNKLNDLNNAWLEFGEAVNKAMDMSPKLTGALDWITSSVRWMAENVTTAVAAVTALATGLTTYLLAPKILATFAFLTAAVKKLNTGLSALAAITNALGSKSFWGWMTRAATAVIAAVGGYKMMNAALSETIQKEEEHAASLKRTLDLMDKKATMAQDDLRAQLDQRLGYQAEYEEEMLKLRERAIRKSQALAKMAYNEDYSKTMPGGGTDFIARGLGDMGEEMYALGKKMEENQQLIERGEAALKNLGSGGMQPAIDQLVAFQKLLDDGTIVMTEYQANVTRLGILGRTDLIPGIEDAATDLGKFAYAVLDTAHQIGQYKDSMESALTTEENWYNSLPTHEFYVTKMGYAINDMATATQSYRDRLHEINEAQTRFTQRTVSTADAVGHFTDGLVDAIMAGENLQQTFQNLIKEFAALIIKAMIYNAVMKSMGFTPYAAYGPGLIVGAGGAQGQAAGGNALTAVPTVTTEGAIQSGPSGSYSGGMSITIDARGAAPGVSAEIEAALLMVEERAVTRSMTMIAEERYRGGSI